MKYFCKDCKKEKSSIGIYCRSCMNINRWKNPKYREKQSKSHMGIIPTNIDKLKIINKGNKYCLGRAPWNKGLIGVLIGGNKGKKCPWVKNPVFKGKDHYLWKKDEVGYSALHSWVRRNLGKIRECVYCGEDEKRIEWASISHHAKRDLNDYIPLCIPCHREYDRKAREV